MSVNARAGSMWSLQPPPPPSQSVPVVPPTPPGASVPPPRRKGFPWLWIILGCGCLLAILIIGGAVYGGWFLYHKEIAPELQRQQELPPPGNVRAKQADGIDFIEPQAKQASSANQPDPDTAVQAALQDKPNWVGKLKWASDDKQRVKVWTGPAGKEFANSVVLQWSSTKDRYVVERVDVIPKFVPPAPKRTVTRSGPSPSRSRAVAKGLSLFERGWVAKVTSNSPDWKRVVMTVGPPQSEYVAEVEVRWNGNGYTIYNAR